MQPGDPIPDTDPQLYYCPLTADWCCWVTEVAFYWVDYEDWWTASRTYKLQPAGPPEAPTGWGFRIPLAHIDPHRPHQYPELHHWPENKLDQGEYAEYLFALEYPWFTRANKRDDFNGIDFDDHEGDGTVQVKYDGKAEESRHVWGQVQTVRKRDIVHV